MKQILTVVLIGVSTILFITYIKNKHKQPKIDYTIKVHQNKATLYDQSNNREVGTCTLDSIGSLIIKDNL